MASVNGKRLKRAIEAFVKSYGRQPTTEEFRGLINGNLRKLK